MGQNHSRCFTFNPKLFCIVSNLTSQRLNTALHQIVVIGQLGLIGRTKALTILTGTFSSLHSTRIALGNTRFQQSCSVSLMGWSTP